MRFVVALVIVVAMFVVPWTTREYRCFLHCDGEGMTETTSLGFPAAYWARDTMPGDPPHVIATRWNPIAFVADVLVLGLILSGLALVTSWWRMRPRGRLRIF